MHHCAHKSSAIAARRFESPVNALRQLGFRLPALRQEDGSPGGGTTLPVSVQKMTGDGEAAEAFVCRLRALAAAEVPVCLLAAEFGDENTAIESWQTFCELAAAALAGRVSATYQLATCVRSHQLPLEASCQIADSTLGSGPRYVIMDNQQTRLRANGCLRERVESNWAFVWREHASARPVMPVYGGFVRSACPLLSEEVAASVLPVGGLHVPEGSAWLPIQVPLARFAGADGQVDEGRLRAALHRALIIVEQLIQRLDWACPRQRADAWENRRVAFILTGFGDLVLRSGRDPTDFACLTWLVGLAKGIRGHLYESSASLATQHGPLPALSINPASGWNAGEHRDGWNRRWQNALRRAAVRHRNLMVISPYSVLPTEDAFAAGFTDLLPLVAHADAWSFSNPPTFTGWDVARFRHFHRRASAIIQGSHAASSVAAGV